MIIRQNILLFVSILIAGFILFPRIEAQEKKETPAWKDMDVPPAPARSPEEEMQTFKIAPGFDVELVASEPMIEDPVDIRWDAKGRLWVVEMRGYMPNVRGEGEQKPVGRVSVLEDPNGDGAMEKSTVFLDDLVLPRTVSFVQGGVLVIAAPKLLYARDTDGDLKADKTRVLKGKFASTHQVEHTSNGLRFAMDNWMYDAHGSNRYRFRDGELITDKSHRRVQWGIVQDNYGRLYTSKMNNWLRADLWPGQYLLRNPDFQTSLGINKGIHNSKDVYPVRINPGVNSPAQLQEDGRLRRITAACGPGIYRGNLFDSSFVGDAFVSEPAANSVAQFNVRERGMNLNAEHVVYEDEKWGKREFLGSTDERFRPINVRTGPDGGLYVVDLYHGIIQHHQFLEPGGYLSKYIKAHGLEKPTGLGRIYRIVPEESSPDYAHPPLDELPPQKLARYLNHPNGTVRDTAQRLIVQGQKTDAAPAIRDVARNGDSHVGRMHALWTLKGIGKLDKKSIFSNLNSKNTHLLQAAIRTGETLLGTEHAEEYVDRLLQLSKHDQVRVRVQSAFSLGNVSDSELREKAETRMVQLLKQHGQNKYLFTAVLSGLKNRKKPFLRKLRQVGLDKLHKKVQKKLEK